MPRANRVFIPGHVWHITHRCHQKEFLLKFRHDRRRWIHWLFEAKKRYGLCVLNYVVTSNHVHLLVKDTGYNVIPRSMQLLAGRTGQEYNQRKGRKGAFWEDRYHATAVQSGKHLAQCLVYIDLNMVRAGVVAHPQEWPEAGYQEIQSPSQRYRIVDLVALQELFGFVNLRQLQEAHRAWHEGAVNTHVLKRDAIWSDSVAVGGLEYIERFRSQLGIAARARKIDEMEDGFTLRETSAVYIRNSALKNVPLTPGNLVFWQQSV